MSFCPREHMDRQVRGRIALKRAAKFSALAERDMRAAKESDDEAEAQRKLFSARLYYQRARELREESVQRLGAE